MIWTIGDVSAFVDAFAAAGEPDQAAIDAYLLRTKRHLPPQARQGVKRYYYLWQDDPRVTLSSIGMPLPDWRGAAMCIVGTREIIGEFAGNRHLLGKKGLQLKLQPIAWLKEPADLALGDATDALEELSTQVLDLASAERIQADITKKYQWKDRRDGR